MTQKKSDRKLLEAEWHLSSLLLLPAWSVNQSLAFFFFFLLCLSCLLLRSAPKSPDLRRRHPSPFYMSKASAA